MGNLGTDSLTVRTTGHLGYMVPAKRKVTPVPLGKMNIPTRKNVQPVRLRTIETHSTATPVRLANTPNGVKMNPASIQVGTVQPATQAQKQAIIKKLSTY